MGEASSPAEEAVVAVIEGKSRGAAPHIAAYAAAQGKIEPSQIQRVRGTLDPDNAQGFR
jgi:hypothetical protein